MDDLLPRVTDENHQDFLSAPAAVILFKIANCNDCEEFEPIVQKAAATYNSSVKFGKALLHVPGACREIKKRHRFESFPTTHFYKRGELVHVWEEKRGFEELVAAIAENLHVQNI